MISIIAIEPLVNTLGNECVSAITAQNCAKIVGGGVIIA